MSLGVTKNGSTTTSAGAGSTDAQWNQRVQDLSARITQKSSQLGSSVAAHLRQEVDDLNRRYTSGSTQQAEAEALLAELAVLETVESSTITLENPIYDENSNKSFENSLEDLVKSETLKLAEMSVESGHEAKAVLEQKAKTEALSRLALNLTSTSVEETSEQLQTLEAQKQGVSQELKQTQSQEKVGLWQALLKPLKNMPMQPAKPETPMAEVLKSTSQKGEGENTKQNTKPEKPSTQTLAKTLPENKSNLKTAEAHPEDKTASAEASEASLDLNENKPLENILATEVSLAEEAVHQALATGLLKSQNTLKALDPQKSMCELMNELLAEACGLSEGDGVALSSALTFSARSAVRQGKIRGFNLAIEGKSRQEESFLVKEELARELGRVKNNLASTNVAENKTRATQKPPKELHESANDLRQLTHAPSLEFATADNEPVIKARHSFRHWTSVEVENTVGAQKRKQGEVLV